MAKYRVLTKSWIGNTIVEPGEVIEYDGKAGSNLQPLKKRRGEAAEAEGDAEPDSEGEAETPALA